MQGHLYRQDTMKFIESITENIKKYNSWQSRYGRLKESEHNIKARRYYQKKISDNYPEQTLSEEQEAILFSQEFRKLFLKNPSAAEFASFEEYDVQKDDCIYIIKGYCDCTNSYGAKIREPYQCELYKKDNTWTCITDIRLKLLKKIFLIGLIISLPTIIAYCSIPTF